MNTIALSDQQVFELALRLPRKRQLELAEILSESDEQVAPLVNEGGVWVIASKAVGDIEGMLERVREERLQHLMKGSEL